MRRDFLELPICITQILLVDFKNGRKGEIWEFPLCSGLIGHQGATWRHGLTVMMPREPSLRGLGLVAPSLHDGALQSLHSLPETPLPLPPSLLNRLLLCDSGICHLRYRFLHHHHCTPSQHQTPPQHHLTASKFISWFAAEFFISVIWNACKLIWLIFFICVHQPPNLTLVFTGRRFCCRRRHSTTTLLADATTTERHRASQPPSHRWVGQIFSSFECYCLII